MSAEESGNIDSESDSQPTQKKAKTQSRSGAAKNQVPAALLNIDINNAKTFITIAEEVSPVDEKKGSLHAFGIEKGKKCTVATTIMDPDTLQSYPLQEFNTHQLRVIAGNVGVKQVSYMTKFTIRRALASMIEQHEKVTASGPMVAASSKRERRYNSNLRLINVIFEDEGFLPTFLQMNDQRKRSDHETGGGGKNQRFWQQVSQEHNDTSQDEKFGQLFYDEKDDIATGHFRNDPCLTQADLTDFDHATYMSCAKVVSDMLAVRAIILNNMRKSGSHSNDPMDYVDAALKAKKAVASVGKAAGYYFFIRSSQVPDFDKSFTKVMDESFRGGTNLGNDDDDDDDTAKGSKSDTKRRDSWDPDDALEFFQRNEEHLGEVVGLLRTEQTSQRLESLASTVRTLHSIRQGIPDEDQRAHEYDRRIKELEDELLGTK